MEAVSIVTIKNKIPLFKKEEEAKKDHWIMAHRNDTNPYLYVEVHIDRTEDNTPLDLWILGNYPELEHEESFLIKLN